MDTDLFKAGQWLKFRKETCFGKTKDHLGTIVAIDDTSLIAIAVNGTSKIVSVTVFADQNNINPLETIVIISPNDTKGSLHFGQKTAFDCNRPSYFSITQMQHWINENKVELVSYNQEVSAELLSEIKKCILNSPMVPEKYKKIVRNS